MITLLLFAAGIFSLALGGMVVVSQPRRVVSWIFACLTLATALWAIFVGGFWASHGVRQLLLLAQGYYIAAALIAPLILVLVMGIVGVTRKLLYILIALPALMMVLAIAVWPNWLIVSISTTGINRAYLSFGAYLIYIGYFIGYYGIAIAYALYMSLRKSHLSLQLRSVALAFCIAGVIGVFFNLFLPAVENYSLIWVGPLCLFVFVPMVYWAIHRHRLFDVRVTLMSTLAYLFTICLLAFIYLALLYLVAIVSNGGMVHSPVLEQSFYLLVTLVVAVLFHPTLRFFDVATERAFAHGWYDTADLLLKVGDSVTSRVSLPTLLRDLTQIIGETLEASHVGLMALDRDTPEIVTHGVDLRFSAGEARTLVAYVREHSELINVGSIVGTSRHNAAAYTLLERYHIALVAPLVSRQDIVGVLFIGKRVAGGYGKHDIEAVQAIIDELSIAIQNAISLQEVRDLNANLEKRVATATRELRRSNTELKALDETKDEFISMASHQLRTPLTSIKGYISMVLEGDAGKISAQQQQLLSEAFTSSERMVHLIGDFLNVSRLQTGKFIIERQPTDLAQLVNEEVESMRSIAESHGMTLIAKIGTTVPTLNVDGDKLRQVIMNFIDNAIFYSHPQATIVVKLMHKGSNAVLEVHDQGIGVPAAAQARLFSKFFRADNARRQRPDGTGIGLFLAKKVVTAQGGKMVFESTEGRGSVFGFSLPIRH